MPEALLTDTVPLTKAGGVIFVTGTRVTLDTIAGAFSDGATAEEIAQQYPSVSLTAVYQVIGYYLGHRPELDSYLEIRRKTGVDVRAVNESRWPGQGVRDRLLARQR